MCWMLHADIMKPLKTFAELRKYEKEPITVIDLWSAEKISVKPEYRTQRRCGSFSSDHLKYNILRGYEGIFAQRDKQ